MLLLLTLAHANPTVVSGDRPASHLVDTIARQQPRLYSCFGEDRSAQVELDVTVLPSGDVRKVKARSGPEATRACVASQIATLTLPPHHGGKAKLRWQVGLADLPTIGLLKTLATKGTAGVGVGGLIGAKGVQIGRLGLVSGIAPDPDAPVILGALSRAHMDQVIDAARPALRACHEAALAEHPDLEGTLTVKFTVGTEGKVSSAATKNTTLGLPAVEDCVVDHIATLAFDPPEGGGIVIASYPFRFPVE